MGNYKKNEFIMNKIEKTRKDNEAKMEKERTDIKTYENEARMLEEMEAELLR